MALFTKVRFLKLNRLQCCRQINASLMYFSPRLSCSFSKLCMTQVVSLLLQTQPDADVLAVQPQDAADVPGDHPDAS